MKNHPPFVLTRLSNMQRSQHIDPCHTWNAIYNARSNKCHRPNSPNTAPATKNESHDWSLSHMKRYLQCAEQQVSLSKLTKYCACHEKWISWLILVTHETLFTMHGASSVIVQTHQILRLPRKVTVMTDPCHIWNVIYNAGNNRWHPPTSPNIAPATQNDCHDWSSSHMKRHLQCAEQQVSLSKLTKYCACHEKWISWLILVTHETLFTMRGATSVIFQTHQILRLPRKMTLQNFAKISRKQLKRHFQCGADPSRFRAGSEQDPSRIREWSENETVTPQPASQPRLLFTPTTSILYWKIQHFALRLSFQISPNAAPATKSDSSTSPNTAPATQSDCHDWSLSHMKRYLQCGEQQMASSNITEYCACHAKWLSWLILVTYETSFYNARSNKCPCPNSPNTAPATKNESHDWSLSHMKRYLQCAEQQVSLSKRTKYCACHAKWLSKISQKFLENSRSEQVPSRIRAGSEQDPRMIREWNRHSATRLATEVTFHAHHEHFVLKNTTFRAPAIIPNFTECWACHEKWQFNITECCACHEKWQFNITKYCACHAKWLSWLDWAMTCLSYYLTELLLDMSYDLTELWLDWAITSLSYFLTELLLDWAIAWLELWLVWAMTWLSYYLTELLLDMSYDYCLTWAMTWLSYYLTWAMTWLSYYLTELLLDMSYDYCLTWAMTWLSYYLTWAMTWLSYYLTWAMTWLSYDLTELLLDMSYDLTELLLDLSYDLTWAMTWLSYYLTELWLWLDWAMTWLSYCLTAWLSYYLTELWLDWAMAAISFVYRKFLN